MSTQLCSAPMDRTPTVSPYCLAQAQPTRSFTIGTWKKDDDLHWFCQPPTSDEPPQDVPAQASRCIVRFKPEHVPA